MCNKKLKSSRFNFIKETTGGAFVLFNSATSGTIFIPVVISEIVKKLLSTKLIWEDKLSGFEKKLVQTLIKGGFLVDSTIDEIQAVKDRFEADYTGESLNVTICPTLACNLNCTYCYQSREPGRMSLSTADKVIDQLINKLASGGYRTIEVDWFGGEPFLTPDLIDYISKRLIRSAKGLDAEYYSSIVTNGTHLPEDLCDFLLRNCISGAQVTLDGYPDTHNSNRPFKSGKESFNEVVSGVIRLASYIPVTLRINIDLNGFTPPLGLVELLEKIGFFDNQIKVYPYLAPIAPLSAHCAPACENALGSEVFFEYLLSFRKLLSERHPSIPLERIVEIPKPLSKACGAQSAHSITIHPSGLVYKCGLEIHEPDNAANFIDQKYELHPNYRKWVDAEALEHDECKSCVFYPVCMGGCPKYNFQSGYKHERESCVFWHKHFPEILPIIANKRMMRLVKASA